VAARSHLRIRRLRALVAGGAVLAALTTAAACTSAAPGSPTERDDGSLVAWAHAGTIEERAAMRGIVADWNDTNPDARVELVELTEGDYGNAVQTAIVAGELPDVLEVDGPLVASYVHQGALLPLDGRLAPEVDDAMLASLRTQGTVAGRLHAVGMFESGLGLFADRDRLAEVGARVPRGPGDAWSAREFRDVLADLADTDPDRRVLDLKRNYGVGEWLTYGFAPLVWSAGGELLDPRTGRASGALDSDAAVRALTVLRSWQPYVDPNPDDRAFPDRRVALSWVGHWAYPAYAEALGDDLVLLPLPDLGEGSRSTSGSWAWAVSAATPRPDTAVSFLEHLVSTRSVRTMTEANGAVPGTWPALEADPRFDPGGALAPYAEALTHPCSGSPDEGCVATARPRTPAYPTLTYAFASAVDAVLRGQDPAAALAEAADAVDADIAANDGYRRAVPDG
jgi:multiple sugar transport system substrate-binding protein